MNVYNVLIVEDEKEIADALEIYLKNQGYRVLKASNGIEGLEIIEKEEIHLALVDIMMPLMSGDKMVMELRKKYEFPVIMLTAKSEEIDKITGLNIGADDYVTKPFNPMELIARVNSHIRRYAKFLNLKNGIREDNNSELISVGGLELNLVTKEVIVDGNPIKITPIEFKILKLLMENPGRVFSADEIYEKVWNEEAINTDTVMVHVRHIREKIEVDAKKPKYLKVVWGIGYKIERI
ncbi:response regulator transcription factor [Clostridium sp. HCP1S3_B4]|uniref:response regulator transcription factor n=1 Tax=unclassified Clostridium TaxID=2614128 RepID=UPI002A792C14|nr:response regulator transcription factor [Clostridiales bacterium]MDY2730388.1 response regulator transcription factor [Clostridium sp.]